MTKSEIEEREKNTILDGGELDKCTLYIAIDTR